MLILGWISDSFTNMVVGWVYSIYWSIAGLYDFVIELNGVFNVFNAPIVTTISKNLYALIGIYMFLRVVINLLQMLVDPDKVTDKNTGGGKIVVRIVVAIILLLTMDSIIFKQLGNLQNAVLSPNGLFDRIFDLGDQSGECSNPDYTTKQDCESHYYNWIPSGSKLEKKPVSFDDSTITGIENANAKSDDLCGVNYFIAEKDGQQVGFLNYGAKFETKISGPINDSMVNGIGAVSSKIECYSADIEAIVNMLFSSLRQNDKYIAHDNYVEYLYADQSIFDKEGDEHCEDCYVIKKTYIETSDEEKEDKIKDFHLKWVATRPKDEDNKIYHTRIEIEFEIYKKEADKLNTAGDQFTCHYAYINNGTNKDQKVSAEVFLNTFNVTYCPGGECTIDGKTGDAKIISNNITSQKSINYVGTKQLSFSFNVNLKQLGARTTSGNDADRIDLVNSVDDEIIDLLKNKTCPTIKSIISCDNYNCTFDSEDTELTTARQKFENNNLVCGAKDINNMLKCLSEHSISWAYDNPLYQEVLKRIENEDGSLTDEQVEELEEAFRRNEKSFDASDNPSNNFAGAILSSFVSPSKDVDDDLREYIQYNNIMAHRQDVGDAYADDEINIDTLTAIILGIATLVMLVVLGVEVVIRNMKILLLEIMSPIAIMSFIDPKSKVFGAWVKQFVASYADLFLKLIAIRSVGLLVGIFGLFSDGLDSWQRIFIVIGALVFAKTIPNFISNIFGIKDASGTFKESFAMLKGAAFGAAGAAVATGAVFGNAGRAAAAARAGGLGGKGMAGAAARSLLSFPGAALKGARSGASGKVGAVGSDLWKKGSSRNALYKKGIGSAAQLEASTLGKFGLDAVSRASKKNIPLEKREASLQGFADYKKNIDQAADESDFLSTIKRNMASGKIEMSDKNYKDMRAAWIQEQSAARSKALSKGKDLSEVKLDSGAMDRILEAGKISTSDLTTAGIGYIDFDAKTARTIDDNIAAANREKSSNSVLREVTGDSAITSYADLSKDSKAVGTEIYNIGQQKARNLEGKTDKERQRIKDITTIRNAGKEDKK